MKRMYFEYDALIKGTKLIYVTKGLCCLEKVYEVFQYCHVLQEVSEVWTVTPSSLADPTFLYEDCRDGFYFLLIK